MAPTYWHGGPAGLPIGSTLLPRAHLEHLSARDAALGGLVLAVADRSGEHDPAHVYVTTGKPMGQLVAEAVVDAYPEHPTARSR